MDEITWLEILRNTKLVLGQRRDGKDLALPSLLCINRLIDYPSALFPAQKKEERKQCQSGEYRCVAAAAAGSFIRVAFGEIGGDGFPVDYKRHYIR